MLKIVNRGAFNAKASAWTHAVRKAAELAAMNMAEKALDNVVTHGPQFSGQFVASWNLSVGTPDFTARQPVSRLDGDNVEPYQEGDANAINIARTANVGKLAGFRLGQHIYLSNSVEHDEPYSVLIETNQIRFRPVNPSGGRTLGRAFDYLVHRYSSIGKSQLAELIGV